MHKRICKLLCISTGAVHPCVIDTTKVAGIILFNDKKPRRAEQAQKANTNAKKRERGMWVYCNSNMS